MWDGVLEFLGVLYIAKIFDILTYNSGYYFFITFVKSLHKDFEVRVSTE